MSMISRLSALALAAGLGLMAGPVWAQNWQNGGQPNQDWHHQGGGQPQWNPQDQRNPQDQHNFQHALPQQGGQQNWQHDQQGGPQNWQHDQGQRDQGPRDGHDQPHGDWYRDHGGMMPPVAAPGPWGGGERYHDWHHHGWWDADHRWHWFYGWGPQYGYYGPPPVYYPDDEDDDYPPPPGYYAPPPVYAPPVMVVPAPSIVITPGGIGITP